MKKKKFRWDLFLRDYRAYMDRQSKTLKETGYAFDVNPQTLSRLRSGGITHVGDKILNKILKGIGMYYEFYCED